METAGFAQPATDERLREALAALDRIDAGEIADAVESETLDCKEEPGRRGAGGSIGPSVPRSDEVARYLVAELTCLANHEGGVLLLGLDDKRAGADAWIGTDVNVTWIVQRIHELTRPSLRVSVEPLERHGRRVLAFVVPRNDGTEPHVATVSKSGGTRRLRRNGTSCKEMETLAEQMAWAQERQGYDWSARPSGLPAAAARAAAIDTLRDLLRTSQQLRHNDLADASDADLLRRLQLVRPDGSLNRAGALLIAPADRPRLQYLGRPAAGAPSQIRVEAAGRGLAEELAAILQAIAAANRAIVLPGDGAAVRTSVHAVPEEVVREVLVNAIMHRDWDIPRPIVVDHTGDEIVVFSPGGFYGGVTPQTVLTAASSARNRMLGDALRSLGLAEREGTGVDRMYIDMIRLGHRRPEFAERDSGVRVVLRGGDPIPEVVAAHAGFTPRLQRTARAAVALDMLRRTPSFSLAELMQQAQEGEAELTGFVEEAVADGMLKPTASTRPGGERAWRLTDELRQTLGPVLPYFSRPREESIGLIDALARSRGSVRSSDVQDLLGISPTRASNLLQAASQAGLITLGPGAQRVGRGTYYVPTASP